MTTISLEEVVAATEEIVNEFGPDHTVFSEDNSPFCVYYKLDRGKRIPVCIVGQVLNKYDLLDKVTPRLNKLVFDATFLQKDDPDGEVLHEIRSHFEDRALGYLRDAQIIQDGGGAWGKAVEEAKRLNDIS